MDLKEFELDGELRFVDGNGGLAKGVITTDDCRGSFYLHGGHVAEFQPSGAEPVLFLSDKAVYQEGKAIRGGIPVCFPWFGAKQSPSHGPVRTERWTVTGTERTDLGVLVTLQCKTDTFQLNYRITFGRQLSLEMCITNFSTSAATCELALHTYFTVDDITKVKITGLENAEFLDQLTGDTIPATAEPIGFSAETDRIYHGEVKQILLADSSLGRTIALQPSGSRSTVVWNPWVEKSKRMDDFGDDEYPRMCCIETANIDPNAIRLGPGDSATTGVTIALV